MYFLRKIHRNKIARHAIHLYTYIDAKIIFRYSPKETGRYTCIPVYVFYIIRMTRLSFI